MTDNVVSTYDAIAEKYAATCSDLADYLDDFLGLLPPRAFIVDVGCGPGVELAHCQAKGFAVEGIDLSTKMVRLAQKLNPDVRVSVADILSFDLPVKATACVASYSLIHLTKQAVPLALQNIRRNLDENGFLYIAVYEGLSGETVRPEPLDPELRIFRNIFSKEEIIRCLTDAGFHVVDTRSGPTLPDEEFPCRKLVLFAKTKEAAV